MTIADRIAESETKFNQLQENRNEYLKQAEDLLTEMTKLQGEWRVLKELEAQEAGDSEDTSDPIVSDKATTIDVVADNEE